MQIFVAVKTRIYSVCLCQSPRRLTIAHLQVTSDGSTHSVSSLCSCSSFSLSPESSKAFCSTGSGETRFTRMHLRSGYNTSRFRVTRAPSHPNNQQLTNCHHTQEVSRSKSTAQNGTKSRVSVESEPTCMLVLCEVCLRTSDS